MSDAVKERRVRDLMQHVKHGVLSTLSARLEGFPFGSVVPFCFDRRGVPVILIADIAEHTRNLLADSRACLTVVAEKGDDVQEAGRVSLVSRGEPLADAEEAAARYYRHYPQSRDYHRTHGFAFYGLAPVRVRFIGGFGDIHWVEASDFLAPNPFSAAEETGIVEHMNRDHQKAMRHYLTALKGIDPGEVAPRMTGIDGEGFDLLLGRRLVRFAFDEPVRGAEEARARLVAMAKARVATPD